MKYIGIALLLIASGISLYVIYSVFTDENGIRAICRDGTMSKSKVNRGTCSKHGGVLYWTKD